MREFGNGTGELIFYQRANEAGSKESEYVISPTVTPDSLREALTLAYGQIGRVEKQRTLFMTGRTRIHRDRVNGLGEFLELEVVLRDYEFTESGVAEASSMMERLGIDTDSLIKAAYVDLLMQLCGNRH